MEDYEAQEVEFWRKLHETDMSRSQMLKRSIAAATGLTVLASPGLAWARERGIRSGFVLTEPDNDAANALYAGAGGSRHPDVTWTFTYTDS